MFDKYQNIFIWMCLQQLTLALLVPTKVGAEFAASIQNESFVGGDAATKHEAAALEAVRVPEYAKEKGIFLSGAAAAIEAQRGLIATEDGANQFNSRLNSVLTDMADLKASVAQMEEAVREAKEAG